MTNEEIDRAIFEMLPTLNLPGGQYYFHPKPEELARLRECISRLVAQAYEEAKREVCNCFAGTTAKRHHIFCAASKIDTLKDSLVPEVSSCVK